MDKTNKRMAVSYKLYIDGDNGKEMIEEAPASKPFQFISGFGYALDAFEDKVTQTPEGDDFTLTLTKEQAYGEYLQELVLDLDREMFVVNGRFDSDHIFVDAVIPLQNEEGQRFNGRVVEIGTDKVKVDLNHPLAGETLHFEGKVLMNQEATKAEIDQMIKHMTGGCGGCGGGCHHGDCGGGCHHGDCGGDCDKGSCGEGGCGGCH